jgi:hypothetical protein
MNRDSSAYSRPKSLADPVDHTLETCIFAKRLPLVRVAPTIQSSKQAATKLEAMNCWLIDSEFGTLNYGLWMGSGLLGQ